MQLRKNGFTLVEILVAMALGLIIMGVVTYGFHNTSRASTRALSVVEAGEKARVVIGMLERDLSALHPLGAVTATDNSITFLTFRDPESSLAGEYQAEAHTSRSLCTTKSSNSGYTGTGYQDMGGSGSYFEWNNVNEGSGTFTLSFRYALGNDTATRDCDITVNGVSVGTVPFSYTGAWDSWSTMTIEAPLNTGSNTVRVTASTGAGGPNVDKMEVCTYAQELDLVWVKYSWSNTSGEPLLYSYLQNDADLSTAPSLAADFTEADQILLENVSDFTLTYYREDNSTTGSFTTPAVTTYGGTNLSARARFVKVQLDFTTTNVQGAETNSFTKTIEVPGASTN